MSEVDEMSAASRGSHDPDIVERLLACETRPLTTMSEECKAVTRDPAAWVELWKTLNDARVEIERLRLREEEVGAILRQVGWIQRMLAKWPDRDKEGDLLRLDHAALLALLERNK